MSYLTIPAGFHGSFLVHHGSPQVNHQELATWWLVSDHSLCRMLVLLLAPRALANLSSYDSQPSSLPAASAPSSYIGGGSQVQSQALPQAQAPSQGLPSGHDQDQDLNKCIDIMCFEKIAWSDRKVQ